MALPLTLHLNLMITFTAAHRGPGCKVVHILLCRRQIELLCQRCRAIMTEKGLGGCDKGLTLFHVDKEGQLYSSLQAPSTVSCPKSIHSKHFPHSAAGFSLTTSQSSIKVENQRTRKLLFPFSFPERLDVDIIKRCLLRSEALLSLLCLPVSNQRKA